MVGSCRLCGKEAELQFGHIFPRFAVNWLKKTSATGFLRNSLTAQRQQDSERAYLMCRDCEQILSKDEKTFAEKIFIPYHEKNVTEFEYGTWLTRFLAGLHWKTLLCRTSDSSPVTAKDTFDAVESELRLFLVGKAKTVGRAEFHIFLGDVIRDANFKIAPKLNWYINRTLDADRISNKLGTLGIYAKFLKVMTFAFLTARDPVSESWQGTQVAENGILRTPQNIESKGLGPFLTDRATAVAKAVSELPSREKERIERAARANPERVRRSEGLQVYLADRKLAERIETREAVNRATYPLHRVKGRDRNQPCPCGSGEKAKKCHGR
jgi:hypothetical protein